MHIHAYATRFPGGDLLKGLERSPDGGAAFMASPITPQVTRDWLKRPTRAISATFENADDAADWHAKWMTENPRPETSWILVGPVEKVEFTRTSLSGGTDRVDAFYTGGGEHVSLSFVCCPRDGYVCPEGR